MGIYRDVFDVIYIRIPKGFLWGFYIDFYKGFIGIHRDSKGLPVGKMRWPWPTLPGLDSDELVMSYMRWAMAHIVFFAKSNNIHLPFKGIGSIGMPIGHPIWVQRVYIGIL